METFNREQITKIIDDFERAAFSNPKACFASATSEAFEQVRDFFKPKESETPLLDQLESGPWPSFVSDMKTRSKENEPEEKYCTNCGEQDHFIYHRTVANGNIWECSACNEVFTWPEDPKE